MFTAQRLHSPCCLEAQFRSSFEGQVYRVSIELDTVGEQYGSQRRVRCAGDRRDIKIHTNTISTMEKNYHNAVFITMATMFDSLFETTAGIVELLSLIHI